MSNTSASWDAGAFDPSQTFDNLLIPVSGYVPNASLEISGKPVPGSTWKAGSLVSATSIDNDGSIVVNAGCADAAMPLFARGGAEDFDTKADTGNAIGRVCSLLPASGGFEIETTEYDMTETYDVNDFLTAATGDDAGLVTRSPDAYSTRVIVGQVSRGVVEGQYNQSLLSFWTLAIPAVVTT